MTPTLMRIIRVVSRAMVATARGGVLAFGALAVTRGAAATVLPRVLSRPERSVSDDRRAPASCGSKSIPISASRFARTRPKRRWRCEAEGAEGLSRQPLLDACRAKNKRAATPSSKQGYIGLPSPAGEFFGRDSRTPANSGLFRRDLGFPGAKSLFGRTYFASNIRHLRQRTLSAVGVQLRVSGAEYAGKASFIELSQWVWCQSAAL
jgi:hypothetical protein